MAVSVMDKKRSEVSKVKYVAFTLELPAVTAVTVGFKTVATQEEKKNMIYLMISCINQKTKVPTTDMVT